MGLSLPRLNDLGNSLCRPREIHWTPQPFTVLVCYRASHGFQPGAVVPTGDRGPLATEEAQLLELRRERERLAQQELQQRIEELEVRQCHFAAGGDRGEAGRQTHRHTRTDAHTRTYSLSLSLTNTHTHTHTHTHTTVSDFLCQGVTMA